MPLFHRPGLRNQNHDYSLNNIGKDNKSRSEADSEASNKKPEVKQSLAQILRRYQNYSAYRPRPAC